MADTQTSIERLQRDLREIEPSEIGRDVMQQLRTYVRKNPESAALWCVGIGFVLGWKLKIW